MFVKQHKPNFTTTNKSGFYKHTTYQKGIGLFIRKKISL